MARPGILTIIVLYKRSLEESEAFVSLRTILQQRPDLAESMKLLVYDNSPTTHDVPAFPAETCYVSDTSNAGLACAYNAGLQLAGDENIDWLLLLDQDTLLTEAYLAEAVALAHSADGRFDALVPKLIEDGVVLSPHLPLTLRHPKPIDITTYGISARELHPYNSGSLVRVRTVQRLQGFPKDFPIDYLDHATFRILQTEGGKIFVMRAALEHKLSSNHANNSNDPSVLARQKNTLRAEHAFYRRYGTIQEKFYHHVRLVWRAWKALRAGSFKQGYLLLKTAVTP